MIKQMWVSLTDTQCSAIKVAWYQVKNSYNYIHSIISTEKMWE